jgi:hypothetical protein
MFLAPYTNWATLQRNYTILCTVILTLNSSDDIVSILSSKLLERIAGGVSSVQVMAYVEENRITKLGGFKGVISCEKRGVDRMA